MTAHGLMQEGDEQHAMNGRALKTDLPRNGGADMKRIGIPRGEGKGLDLGLADGTNGQARHRGAHAASLPCPNRR